MPTQKSLKAVQSVHHLKLLAAYAEDQTQWVNPYTVTHKTLVEHGVFTERMRDRKRWLTIRPEAVPLAIWLASQGGEAGSSTTPLAKIKEVGKTQLRLDILKAVAEGADNEAIRELWPVSSLRNGALSGVKASGAVSRDLTVTEFGRAILAFLEL